MPVVETAEKMLPVDVRTRLSSALQQLAAVLSGRGEKDASRRMAMVAFVIRILSAALAFVSQIILARIMGEFEYGIFVFVWVLVVIAGNLSCIGFHTAVIRFLPQYKVSGDDALIRGLTSTARRFALASAGGLALAGMIALHFGAGSIAPYYAIPLFLGLLIMPLIALGDVLDGTSRANHWPVMALSPTFLVRPTLILVFMVGGVLLGAPHSAVTAAEAALAATFVTTVGQYLAVTIRLRRHVPAGPREIRFSAWMAVAFPIFLIEGVGYLLTNSDVIVVGLFLEPEQVAIYFAAAKTMALVHFVYFSVKAAAGPRFSAIIAEGDKAKLAAFATEATRWAFWPALIVGLCVLAAGSELLSLFGTAFTAGQVVMAILFAGILAKALVGPGEVLLMMAGHQRLCAALYGIALAANVCLNVGLIPRLGIEGAAIATASAMGVEAVLLHLAVRWKLGIVLFAFARPTRTMIVKAFP
ncbi:MULTISPECIES: lipopolysaccharide biosynthesis protein [unclassified Rhizobium]|uniref:lipopolysaccharide biosynthesis protein n=1 Tax=unclassified Rhizobium TaxID=2613769 RepID=UPI001AD967AD|nr:MULTISPECIES: lipopolysaccharide biosynthesis protein [unclassified Rhizobium]MBO9099955.1 lipopolysaccharide biosynthesis protein [Rhizobium sp. L58/93]MBO9135833.1 lipopolysaccharide biosynthesis protein [Rhizobium sp. B209b/85]MBO9169944.1 lipopolysaccharide biosynthesis protein [Rhizobium sp. L245/93]MBO9185902.1 lipopolysaccharide biosynthesis protein [Rhizobium sp. E27B/91]QXZ82769.1 lipopolysaccharide biosynthesis protein [Rhizobium sp. K1/93]